MQSTAPSSSDVCAATTPGRPGSCAFAANATVRSIPCPAPPIPPPTHGYRRPCCRSHAPGPLAQHQIEQPSHYPALVRRLRHRVDRHRQPAGVDQQHHLHASSDLREPHAMATALRLGKRAVDEALVQAIARSLLEHAANFVVIRTYLLGAGMRPDSCGAKPNRGQDRPHARCASLTQSLQLLGKAGRHGGMLAKSTRANNLPFAVPSRHWKSVPLVLAMHMFRGEVETSQHKMIVYDQQPIITAYQLHFAESRIIIQKHPLLGVVTNNYEVRVSVYKLLISDYHEPCAVVGDPRKCSRAPQAGHKGNPCDQAAARNYRAKAPATSRALLRHLRTHAAA